MVGVVCDERERREGEYRRRHAGQLAVMLMMMMNS